MTVNTCQFYLLYVTVLNPNEAKPAVKKSWKKTFHIFQEFK